MLRKILEEKNMSLYELSKRTQIAYSTLSNIKNNHTDSKKISAEIIYKIAKSLNITMDELYERLNVPYRFEFELFKSEMCHTLKRMGDYKFVLYLIEEDLITKYWNWEWYPESLYTLAMLDYLSKLYGAPICNKYDFYRGQKLDKLLYPKDAIMFDELCKTNKMKEKTLKYCNPEFLKYNIVAGDIRDVV